MKRKKYTAHHVRRRFRRNAGLDWISTITFRSGVYRIRYRCATRTYDLVGTPCLPGIGRRRAHCHARKMRRCNEASHKARLGFIPTCHTCHGMYCSGLFQVSMTALWRNGSAFDSRSKGYPFKSGQGQFNHFSLATEPMCYFLDFVP